MNIPVYYEYKADGVDNTDEIKFTYNKNFKNIFDLYLNNSCTEPSMVGSKMSRNPWQNLQLEM